MLAKLIVGGLFVAGGYALLKGSEYVRRIRSVKQAKEEKAQYPNVMLIYSEGFKLARTALEEFAKANKGAATFYELPLSIYLEIFPELASELAGGTYFGAFDANGQLAYSVILATDSHAESMAMLEDALTAATRVEEGVAAPLEWPASVAGLAKIALGSPTVATHGMTPSQVAEARRAKEKARPADRRSPRGRAEAKKR